MKTLGFLALALLTLLTRVEPVSAQEADPADEAPVEALSALNPRLNTYVGLGLLAPEGAARAGGFGGGATIEVGHEWRTIETGVLVLPTDVNATSVALPIWAKFRVINLDRQAWFLKAGGITAFSGGGPRAFDVLASAGVAGRIGVLPWADLVVDVTYNRGLLDPLTNEKSIGKDAGALVFLGLSFPL